MERLPWELFQKHLKGELSSEGELRLKKWVEESREHRLLFEETVNDANEGREFAGSFYSNTHNEWQNLQRKIAMPKFQKSMWKR